MMSKIKKTDVYVTEQIKNIIDELLAIIRITRYKYEYTRASYYKSLILLDEKVSEYYENQFREFGDILGKAMTAHFALYLMYMTGSVNIKEIRELHELLKDVLPNIASELKELEILLDRSQIGTGNQVKQ